MTPRWLGAQPATPTPKESPRQPEAVLHWARPVRVGKRGGRQQVGQTASAWVASARAGRRRSCTGAVGQSKGGEKLHRESRGQDSNRGQAASSASADERGLLTHALNRSKAEEVFLWLRLASRPTRINSRQRFGTDGAVAEGSDSERGQKPGVRRGKPAQRIKEATQATVARLGAGPTAKPASKNSRLTARAATPQGLSHSASGQGQRQWTLPPPALRARCAMTPRLNNNNNNNNINYNYY
jgi:hypothetical protein